MSKIRVLIIDDEAHATRLFKLNLESTGKYEVHEENFGRRGLATAREFKPDLIFLDVMMPDMDGGDLAARMRESQALKDTPIVFLTAAVQQKEIDSRGGLIGGFPYLAKPVDLGEIEACIEKTLTP
jgi:DNA-binding response OmpR family regulator